MASYYLQSREMGEYGSDIQERFSVVSQEPVAHVALEPKDLPAIFEGLKSTETEVWNESLNKLNAFMENQRELIEERLDLIDLAVLFDVASTTSDETLRTCLLEIAGNFTSLSSDSLSKVIPFIPKLVPHLASGNVVDLHQILSILDEVTAQHPSTEEDIVQQLTTLYSPVIELDSESEADETRVIALVEAFENCLVYSRSTLIPIFTKASVVDAVLVASMLKATKIRTAAMSCFSQMISHVDEIDSHLPDETNRGNLTVFIFVAFANLACDDDHEISRTAASAIGEDRGELNPLMRIVLSDRLDVIRSVILQIGRKRPNTVGVPAEYAILRLIEETDDGTNMKEAVTKAFSEIWNDEEITAETKLQIISGLNDSFVDIRKVAIDGGLCNFVIKTSRQEAHAVSVLELFDKAMDTEQLIGSALIDMEGGLQHFVDLFVNEGPSDVRKLAGSILSRSLDSYDDGKSRRDDAAKFLTSSTIRPRILSALNSEDPQVVNAGLHLLGEILVAEMGFVFGDEDAVPASPMKDILVTKELVDQTMKLLQSPSTVVEALYLLSQFTWEYKRGFELVQHAFEAVVPTADVFFFQSLYGSYTGRHAGRQKRSVSEAALKAGGLQRVLSLLEEEHETVEARRASVEATRVILSAESADLDVGRKSTWLAKVVATLLQDDTVESLKVARFMIRLLAYDLDSTTNAMDAWKGIISSDTLQHLMRWATKGPEVVEGPTDEEEEEPEENKEKRKQALEDYEQVLSGVAEILKGLQSIIRTFPEDIIPPIIQGSVSRDVYQPAELLEFLREFITDEDQYVQPLIKSIQDVLSTSQTPEFDKYYEWISSNAIMCSAFYQAGIVDYILKAYDLAKDEVSPEEKGEVEQEKKAEEEQEEKAEEEQAEKDEEEQEEKDEDERKEDAEEEEGLNIDDDSDNDSDDNDHMIELIENDDEIGHLPIKLLAHLAEHISDEEKLKSLQDMFIAHDKAVAHALRYIRNREAVYDSQEMARNVYFLTKDNQAAIDVIANANIYDDLLHLFQNEDAQLKRVGLLAGLLAYANVDKLAKALTTLMKGKSPHGRKDVIELMQSLFVSSEAGKEAVLKAKPIQFLRKALKGDDTDVKEVALVFFGSLFVAGSPDCADFFGFIAKMFQDEEGPLAKALEVVRSVLTDEHAPAVIESGFMEALFKVAVDNPGAVGDMDLVVGTLGDMANLGACHEKIVSLIKDHNSTPEALEKEKDWAASYMFRMWLANGGSSLPTLVEAGGLDYALMLLRCDNLYYNVKGAALVESFAHATELRDQVQPWLSEHQIQALLLQIQAKCLEESSQELKEGETAEKAKERAEMAKGWCDAMAVAIKIVNGEEIEGYEPNYWIIGPSAAEEAETADEAEESAEVEEEAEA